MTEDRWLENLSLDGLTTEQKQILFLRYAVGLTQQEVADVLGRLQPSVARTERAALRALRTQLSGTIFDPSGRSNERSR